MDNLNVDKNCDAGENVNKKKCNDLQISLIHIVYTMELSKHKIFKLRNYTKEILLTF